MNPNWQTLDEMITATFGERCPDYEVGCAICDAWALLDAERIGKLFKNKTLLRILDNMR